MRAHELSSIEAKALATTQKQREQDWLRRQKEIEAEQATDISTAWYVMAWSYCMSMLTGIQQAFQSVDALKLIHPDNPGSREIFANVGSSILPSIIKFASPIALGLSWINAIQTARNFAKKENKNIWAYANLVFSIAAPIIWTSLYIAGLTLSVAALAPVLPWVTVAVFGVFALHGIFHCVTNCYRAWQAHRSGNKEERNEYLKQAGKNLLGIVFNVIALTMSVILGIKMSEASSKMADAIDYFSKTFSLSKINDVLNNITDLFTTGCNLAAALTAVAVTGVVASIASGVKAAFNWFRGKSTASKTAEVSVVTTNSDAFIKMDLDPDMQRKIEGYDQLIKDKYQDDMKKVPDKIKAKRMLLKQLNAEDRNEPVAKVIAKIKKQVRNGKGDESDFDGRVVFQSLFKPKGDVQLLAEKAQNREESLHVGAAPAA